MGEFSTDILRQYQAARDYTALFDRSGYAKVQLSGKDARDFLHNLCTNDVKNLKPGQGCEAFLTTAKARVIAHVVVTCYVREAEEVLWLDSVPGSAETVLKHLNHFLISEQVEVSDLTRDLAMLHLCGPAARELLSKAGWEVPETLPHLHHIALDREGGPLFVRRNDRLGLGGYDLVCGRETVAGLRERLASDAVPAGAEAFEILRIEAGIPMYGKDMDENRFVVEVGRTAQAISFTKGCYLGQEPIVMARDRGHVNRFFAGVQIAEGTLPAPGVKLLRDGAEVGEVTSSVFSAKLGAPIALAYLRRGHQDPGTALQLEDGRAARVISLPV